MYLKRTLRNSLFVLWELCLGSCVPITYDERTNGLDVVLDVDDIFTVSLPYIPGISNDVPSQPEIDGRAIGFIARGIDELKKREWFKFAAVEVGEAHLTILSGNKDDRRSERIYSLQVKVRLCEW